MANKLDVPSLWCAQMARVVARQDELAAGAYSVDQTPEEMRRAYRSERRFWNEGGPQVAAVSERAVATPFGSVAVRQYRPTDDGTLPVIVFIHGGGWVLGGLDTHDRIARSLAADTGAAVVSVDYTLSPEARYPQPVGECVAVVKDLRTHAEQWGIDPNDISFAGDSGGANMAFGTYLHLRDEERCSQGIRCLLLFYGAFGLRDSMSMRLLGGEWDGMSEEGYAYYLDRYLRDPSDRSAPYFDILGNDLTHDIPPCYIAAAELDPLRDDSRTLSAMLEVAGVGQRFEEFPGVIHGFAHHSRMLDASRVLLGHASDFFRSCTATQSSVGVVADALEEKE